MNKYRIAAAAIATVTGFSIFGPTAVSAAKNDGPGNGRSSGDEQVVEVTEVALHNDRADSGTDCPDNGNWWHFVLAPNSGAHTIDAMRLMVSGSEHMITGAQIVPNHGQTDNVFVAVPDGRDIDGLSSAGSSATVTGPTGRVRFVLSHVCGESTEDTESDEAVSEDIEGDEINNDDTVTGDIDGGADEELVTEDTETDDTVTDNIDGGADQEIVTEDIEDDEITNGGTVTDNIDGGADEEIVNSDTVTEDIANDEINKDADDNPAIGVDLGLSNDTSADASSSDNADVPILTAEAVESVIDETPESVTPVERLHISVTEPTSETDSRTDSTTTPITAEIGASATASPTASLPRTGLGLGVSGLAIMLIGIGEAVRRGSLRKVA